MSPAPDWLVEKIVELSLKWKRLARRKKCEAQREEELANRTLAKCYSDCADQLQKTVRRYLEQTGLWKVAFASRVPSRRDLDRTDLFQHRRKRPFCNGPPMSRMTHLDNPVLFLATANAEQSRSFYERALGLVFVADEPPALVFRVGDSILRIQKVEQVHAAPYTALGWAVSDIRRTVTDLRTAGVVFQRYEGLNQDDDGIWHAPSGAFVAWFQDPDGHVLSLTQFP